MKTLIAAISSVAILSSFVTLGTMQLIEMNKQPLQQKLAVYEDVKDNRLKRACDAMRDIEVTKYSDIYSDTISICGRDGYWTAFEVQQWFDQLADASK